MSFTPPTAFVNMAATTNNLNNMGIHKCEDEELDLSEVFNKIKNFFKIKIMKYKKKLANLEARIKHWEQNKGKLGKKPGSEKK